MFEYALPVDDRLAASKAGGSKPEGSKPEGNKPDDKNKGKPGDKGQGGKGKGTIQTQMVGEKPGDDLGYDPKIIPTEKISD